MSKNANEATNSVPQSKKRQHARKTPSIHDYAVHIIKIFMADTVKSVMNNQSIPLKVSLGIIPATDTAAEQNVLSLEFESEAVANTFFARAKNMNYPNLREKLQGKSAEIKDGKSFVYFVVSEVSDLAAIGEEIIKANLQFPSRPPRIYREADLRDPKRANQALLRTNFGYSSKEQLIAHYNEEIRDFEKRPYANFSYSPDDVRQAINAYKKFVVKKPDVKGVQSLLLN